MRIAWDRSVEGARADVSLFAAFDVASGLMTFFFLDDLFDVDDDFFFFLVGSSAAIWKVVFVV